MSMSVISLRSSSSNPFEVSAIQSIASQCKSNSLFNREIYSRILATAFGALVVLNMTLEGFLAIALVPFAATKLAIDQVNPRLITNHMSFEEIFNHLKLLALYTKALIRTPVIIINPKTAPAMYNIISLCYLNPKALSFHSLLNYAWTHQTILQTSAFVITTLVLHRSGLIPTFTRHSPETSENPTQNGPSSDQSPVPHNPVLNPTFGHSEEINQIFNTHFKNLFDIPPMCFSHQNPEYVMELENKIHITSTKTVPLNETWPVPYILSVAFVVLGRCGVYLYVNRFKTCSRFSQRAQKVRIPTPSSTPPTTPSSTPPTTPVLAPSSTPPTTPVLAPSSTPPITPSPTPSETSFNISRSLNPPPRTLSNLTLPPTSSTNPSSVFHLTEPTLSPKNTVQQTDNFQQRTFKQEFDALTTILRASYNGYLTEDCNERADKYKIDFIKAFRQARSRRKEFIQRTEQSIRECQQIQKWMTKRMKEIEIVITKFKHQYKILKNIPNINERKTNEHTDSKNVANKDSFTKEQKPPYMSKVTKKPSRRSSSLEFLPTESLNGSLPRKISHSRSLGSLPMESATGNFQQKRTQVTNELTTLLDSYNKHLTEGSELAEKYRIDFIELFRQTKKMRKGFNQAKQSIRESEQIQRFMEGRLIEINSIIATFKVQYNILKNKKNINEQKTNENTDPKYAINKDKTKSRQKHPHTDKYPKKTTNRSFSIQPRITKLSKKSASEESLPMGSSNESLSRKLSSSLSLESFPKNKSLNKQSFLESPCSIR